MASKYINIKKKGVSIQNKKKTLTIKDEHKLQKHEQAIQGKKIILRSYQQDICEQVNRSKGDVLIEAPTGAGKTVISKQIAQDEINKGGKVLVVVPKLVLMRQTEKTYASLNPEIIHGKLDYDPDQALFISTIQTAHQRDLGFTPTMIIVDEIHHGFKGSMLKRLRDEL